MADTAPARRGSKSPRRRSVAPVQPELDFGELEHEAVEALIARGTAYVREYVRISEQPTILLKNIAKVLVALRARHTTNDGRPDLKGQSHDYRRDAASIYRAAGIPADSEAQIQSAVRYHIGNVIRQQYDEKTLKAYGYIEASPLERIQDYNAVRAALATAASVEQSTADEAPSKVVVANHLRLGSGVVNVLASMQPEHIRDDMTPAQRARLDTQLAEAQETIRRLRRLIKSAGTEG